MATERVINIAELEGKSKEDLIAVAQEMGLEDGTPLSTLRKEDVLHRILQTYSDHQG